MSKKRPKKSKMTETELTVLSYLVIGVCKRPRAYREVFEAMWGEVGAPLTDDFVDAEATFFALCFKHRRAFDPVLAMKDDVEHPVLKALLETYHRDYRE